MIMMKKKGLSLKLAKPKIEEPLKKPPLSDLLPRMTRTNIAITFSFIQFFHIQLCSECNLIVNTHPHYCLRRHIIIPAKGTLLLIYDVRTDTDI